MSVALLPQLQTEEPRFPPESGSYPTASATTIRNCLVPRPLITHTQPDVLTNRAIARVCSRYSSSRRNPARGRPASARSNARCANARRRSRRRRTARTRYAPTRKRPWTGARSCACGTTSATHISWAATTSSCTRNATTTTQSGRTTRRPMKP